MVTGEVMSCYIYSSSKQLCKATMNQKLNRASGKRGSSIFRAIFSRKLLFPASHSHFLFAQISCFLGGILTESIQNSTITTCHFLVLSWRTSEEIQNLKLKEMHLLH